MLRSILTVAVSLALAGPLSGWGALGHRIVAAAALRDLPPEVHSWFAQREAEVPDHSNDPDHWKWRDPKETPRHYLDSEHYGGPDQVPLDLEAAKAMLGEVEFQKSGQVPWVILDRVDRMTQAFRAYDVPQLALEAAYLSHYVGDINVPLHTTANFDGDDTNQHGIHQRWETGLVERIEGDENWVPEVRTAVLGEEPEKAPWAWLQESFSLVPGVLANDVAAQREDVRRHGGGMDEAYWKAFLRLQRSHVKEQLTLSAERTARMILLAWTRAGSPAGPQSSR